MKIIALSSLLLIIPAAVSAAESEPTIPLGLCNSSFQPAGGSFEFLNEDPANYDVDGEPALGNIYFTQLPVFDESNPQENNALYRWANRFHVLSRETTVSQQILFESGQPYDVRLLQETARLLRSQGYLFDADIRPVRQCNDQIDIEVITRDNWTFSPSISLDRSGGENFISAGIRETNILGLGKELLAKYSEDEDRDSYELAYKDENLFGSRIRNTTKIVDSDDGSTQLFDLGLPFFSLGSRRAWNINLENDDRIDEQFYRGDEISEIRHEVDSYTLEYGFSRGLEDGVANRWSFGYSYETDVFKPGEDLPPPDEIPGDGKLSYPFVKFESIEDNYETGFNFDRIQQTEDLHLGHQLVTKIGYAAEDFGSDANYMVLDAFYSDTLAFDGRQLWQHRFNLSGAWNLDASEADDMVLKYESRYFRRQTDIRSLFAGFEAVYSKNLSTEKQIYMGGSTGARAFDNRFQVGDRSVLLTVEERFYTDIHLFNLVRVGWAVFADVGRAWETDTESGMEDDYLANIGFGLRLASSKAATGRVSHIDFAFPLTNQDDPDVDNFQIAFTVQSSF